MSQTIIYLSHQVVSRPISPRWPPVEQHLTLRIHSTINQQQWFQQWVRRQSSSVGLYWHADDSLRHWSATIGDEQSLVTRDHSPIRRSRNESPVRRQQSPLCIHHHRRTIPSPEESDNPKDVEQRTVITSSSTHPGSRSLFSTPL